MNDEVKKILFDLIEYYNAIGTEEDPGFVVFADVAQRASKALERHAKETRDSNQNNNSAGVDPFAMDVVGYSGQEYGGFPEPQVIKPEEEW